MWILLVVVVVIILIYSFLVFAARKLTFPTNAQRLPLIQGIECNRYTWLPIGTLTLGDYDPNKHVIVYCHGNYGNVTFHQERMLMWFRYYNCCIIMPEYEGYISNEKPCINSFHTPIRKTLLSMKDNKKVIVIGESIGGAAAIKALYDLETCYVSKLIVLNTFAFLHDVAGRLRWLYSYLIDDIPSVTRLKEIAERFPNVTIEIINSSDDELIPKNTQDVFKQHLSLYPQCSFYTIQGTHNDYDLRTIKQYH